MPLTLFLSSRAVYILVHNLSKPLNAPAKPCVRQGTHDVLLENPNNETNLENLLSWLVTVNSLKTTEEGMMNNSEGKLPYLRPPVFMLAHMLTSHLRIPSPWHHRYSRQYLIKNTRDTWSGHSSALITHRTACHYSAGLRMSLANNHKEAKKVKIIKHIMCKSWLKW